MDRKNAFDQKPMRSARRKQARPPRLRSAAVFRPTGPRYLNVDEKRSSNYQLFFVPPPGFITFTNSRTEWTANVAIWKVLGIKGDPRNGPFTGVIGKYLYQTPLEGGRAARGGQVVDFIIEGTAEDVGEVLIRITTERYHQLTDAEKHAQDEALRIRLGRYGRVVDVFEQDLMQDPSGQGACITMKQAIFGGTPTNPLRGGNARRLKV